MDLVFTARARSDLADIAAYIARESGHPAIGRAFVHRLVRQCENLSRHSFQLGTPRPEIWAGIRSFVMGNYVIFGRYQGMERLEIVMIVEGHRDVAALFARHDEGSG